MSSSKRKLTLNAASAIIQVGITAIVYFFLYKYLLNILGIKQLGIWSIILSFSSIANLANIGLTSGLVKFVAERIALDKKDNLGKLIFTSFISLALLFLILSAIILLTAKYLLLLVLESPNLALGLAILPYSLGSLFINAMAGVFTSVLEGYQKNYLKNAIYTSSGILMLIFTILLTPSFQLAGVAIAQLLQAVFILVASIFFVIQIDHYNRLTYWRWSNLSFKELFDYGYKFQVVSVAQLFYEPTTKFLLSKYGGLPMVGYYEMASRLVSQVRGLIVGANQVVIPIIAENNVKKAKQENKEFFILMNRLVIIVTIIIYTLLLILIPLITKFWIGVFEYDFIYFSYILIFGWGINIVSNPSYFACLGEGKLNIPIISHLTIALLNFILGWVAGIYLGGIGVVLAWSFSLSIGSIITIILYQRYYVAFLTIFENSEMQLLRFSLAIIVINILISLLFKIEGIFMYYITFVNLIFLSILFFYFVKNNRIFQKIIKSILDVK